jgi:hypothetical protein
MSTVLLAGCVCRASVSPIFLDKNEPLLNRLDGLTLQVICGEL